MIDIKEQELLDIIFELTHIKDEEGNDVPHFCFASDIAVDLNATDEEISSIALKNGYKAFKVFPGETMLGGIVLLADGATMEPVEAMYKEFYGDIPEIAELQLDDDGHLVEIEEESKELKEDYKSDLESKIRNILEYEKPAKDSDGGKPYLFEIDDASERASQAEGDPFWIKRFGDEEPPTDFSKLQVHDATTDEYGANPPVASFMIAGGCNGSGNWTDYLEDLKDTFEKLKDATGCDPLLYQIDTDICDDVWTGFVFMYDHRDNAIEESINRLDEAFKNKRPKIKKVGDPNAKAMWGRTRSQVFKSKKGKGSFTRKDKHKPVYETFATPPKEDVDKFLQLLKDHDWTVEYCREDESLRGDDDVKQYHIQVIDNNKFLVEVDANASDREKIEAHRQYVDAGHADEVWGRAEELYALIQEFDPTRKYNMTYSASFGGVSSTGIDCTGKVTAGIDMRPMYVEDSFVEIGEDFEEVSIEDAVWDGAQEYTQSFMNKAKELNAELQLFTDITPQRKGSDWYGGMIAEMEYDGCIVEIYATDEWRIELDGEEIYDSWDLEQAGIFTDEQLSDADKEGRIDWLQNNGFNFVISCGDVTLSDWDMGYDDVSYSLDEALDLEFYVKEAIPEFKRRFVDELDNSKELTESKKKKKNILKKTAEKHAKTDKKGAMGWFVHPNAGNVELNIQHFNHVNGTEGAGSTISAPAGLGEEADLEIASPYEWEFDNANKFSTVGYSYEDEENPKKYYYSRIPEVSIKFERDTYSEHKLLKRRKNKIVMNGVKKFFDEHPHAKYCIVSCRDTTQHGRYVNAYRVLSESKIEESQHDYWVLSDGVNPRRSQVYPEIENIDEFIAELEAAKTGNYWELLHYVNGDPVKVWSTKDGRLQEDLWPKTHSEDTEEMFEEDEVFKAKVKDWMCGENPCEFQLEDISEDLTWGDVIEAIKKQDGSFDELVPLDTEPRANIWRRACELYYIKTGEFLDKDFENLYKEKRTDLQTPEEKIEGQEMLFDKINDEQSGAETDEPIAEELDLDIIGDESPEGIEFDAQPRENFMHKKWRYGGISYPEFRCPANGKQIFRKDYLDGKYALCKAADIVVEKFFEMNPRNKYCVLLAYKDGKPVGTEIMSGGSEGIWGKEAIYEAAEKHDTLNPKLWDEAGNLKPEVREKILEIVKEFTDGLEEDEIKFKIDDIVIVGSNCSYNYNDKSDLDIHIRMDTDSLECPDNLYPLLYSAYRSLFNNKLDIDFYGIPVEIYVETSDTEQMNEPLDKEE